MKHKEFSNLLKFTIGNSRIRYNPRKLAPESMHITSILNSHID